MVCFCGDIIDKGKILSVFKDIEKRIKEKEKFDKYENEYKIQKENEYKDYSYGIEVMEIAQKSNTPRHIFRWLELSKRMQKILRDKNYKFLFIVDGIDNIKINYKNTFYKRMMKETYDFLHKRNPINEVRLVAGRERTWADMHKFSEIDDRFIGNRSNLKPEKINHVALNEMADVINVRINFILELCDGDSFFKDILKVVYENKKLLNGIDKDLYHNNTRTFLSNLISLTKIVTHRKYQTIRNKRLLVKHELVKYFLRNKFLDGKLFLDSRKDFVEDLNGRYFFNIFFYDDYFEDNLWKGLAVTRIIQYCKFRKNSTIVESELLILMKSCFNYEKHFIVDCLELLKNYGAIDTKIKRNNISLAISKKGLKILDEIYSNQDILHILILDTYLPDTFFINKLIDAHDNELDVNTNYKVAKYKNVITFILFMLQVENYEKKFYLDFGSCEMDIAYDECFKLPIDIDEHLRQLFKIYDSKYLSETEKNSIKKHIENLKVVF